MYALKHWNPNKQGYVENPRIDAFIQDIIAVCKKHRLSLTNEETGAGYVVRPYDETVNLYLVEAWDQTEEEISL